MPAEIHAVQPVLPVRDVSAAINYYARMGFACVFHHAEHPAYACVRRGAVEVHLQWHAGDAFDRPGDRPCLRFVTTDPDALLEEYRDSGLESAMKPPFDTPWGTREFHMHDQDRNVLMFYRSRE